VARRLVPGSLRAQLAVAIALVTILAVGASFIALYSGTSARLQAQIDSQLRTQLAEWRQLTARSDLSTPAALKRTAQRFIAGQRYHAESLLIVVQAAGGPTVSNNADLLAAEEARARSEPEATGLLNSPSGLATASVAEAGSMRVLTTPIDHNGRGVGTLRVASPLTPVRQAQASLRRTFLIVGVVALLLAIAAGAGLASLIAAPLRRMARVAADAGAGSSRPSAARFTLTRSGSPRCSATSCATPSPTPSPATASVSRPAPATAGSRSPSATLARGSRPISSSRSSSASTGSTEAGREKPAAAASASRSPARSSKHTAGASTLNRPRPTEPLSGLSSPATAHTAELPSSGRCARRETRRPSKAFLNRLLPRS
jgi:hypothetical protein